MTGDPLDLGEGVSAVFVTWAQHHPAGIIETHPCRDGQPRASGILFDLPGMRDAFPGRPLWHVVTLQPLTLTPSVLCSDCGRHGWIKNGRWERA